MTNNYMEVKFGSNNTQKIIIKKGEKTNAIIKKLAIKHCLDSDTEMLLKKLIENKLSSIV